MSRSSMDVHLKWPLQLPAWCVAVVLSLFAGGVFHRELSELAARWASSYSDSHGYLVAPLVLVLMWIQRQRLSGGRGGEAWALFGLGGATVAMVLAHGAAIDVVVWALIPFVLWFALWLALGWRAAVALAFPVFYFLFAVPFWAYMTPVLQWLTVKAVTLLLGLVGQEAFIHGELVTVPAGTFEIAGGCAGTNFMVIGLAIGTLMAFLDRLPWRRALLLVLVAAMISAIANWVRVSIIIYWGQVTEMQTSLIADHYTFGWWVFAIAMLPFFWFARRVARDLPPLDREESSPRVVRLEPRVWFAALALTLAPAWLYAMDRRDPGPTPSLTMPVLDSWSGPEAGDFDWEPSFPGATAELLVVYRRGPASVDAYAAFFGRQGPGRKLVGYEARVSGPEGGWTERSIEQIDVGTGGADGHVTERLVVNPWGRERLIWSWYEVRGTPVIAARHVKLREGLRAFGLRPRSGVVALSSLCIPDCMAARETLRDVWSAGLSTLDAGSGGPLADVSTAP